MTSKGIKTGQWNTQSKTGSPSLRNGQNSPLDLMLNLMARNVLTVVTPNIFVKFAPSYMCFKIGDMNFGTKKMEATTTDEGT